MSRSLQWILFPAASLLVALFPVLLVLGKAASDIGLCAVVLLFLAHACGAREWGWLRAPWLRVLLVLWVYMIARSFFADDVHEALRRSLPFVRYPLFATALAYWLLPDAPTRRRFLLVLGTVLLALALDGILQWFTGRDILRHAIVIQPDGNPRLTGLFHDQILGIMLAWLSAPACAAWLVDEQGAWAKGRALWLRLGGCALILAAIALSGERMALLLALFGWLLAAFLLPGRKRYLVCGVSSLVILLALLCLASPVLLARHITSTVNVVTHWWESPYGRLLASDSRLAALHPWFGVGANHFRLACPALYPNDAVQIALFCNLHPHHIYLEWLIEEGVVGLGLFLLFLWHLFAPCLRQWRETGMSALLCGFFIAATLRLWPLASATSFFSPWAAPPFWLVVGGLLACLPGRKESVP